MKQAIKNLQSLSPSLLQTKSSSAWHNMLLSHVYWEAHTEALVSLKNLGFIYYRLSMIQNSNSMPHVPLKSNSSMEHVLQPCRKCACSVVHMLAMSNKTSHFPAFPAANHSSGNWTTLKLILFIEQDIYEKRNTFEMLASANEFKRTYGRPEVLFPRNVRCRLTSGPISCSEKYGMTTAKTSAKWPQEAFSLANSRRKVKSADKTKSRIQCIFYNACTAFLPAMINLLQAYGTHIYT